MYLHRLPPLLLCSLAVWAQSSTQQDPLDGAIRATRLAAAQGRFADAATARQQARELLQHLPPATSRFGDKAIQVAQLYDAWGWRDEANSILAGALNHTAALADSHPSRLPLLYALSASWQQDGNLLKAADYLERAAAADASLARIPGATTSKPGRPAYYNAELQPAYRYRDSPIAAYRDLADLYRTLGRPEAVAAVVEKVRVLAATDEAGAAGFFERLGLEEAAAIYRKLAEQSSDPAARASAWEALGDYYARHGQKAGAVGPYRQAIAAGQSANDPRVSGQVLRWQTKLASTLQFAGLPDEAERIYRQLLLQHPDDSLSSGLAIEFARFFASTDRPAAGAALLQDFLTFRPALDSQSKSSLLFNLANLWQTAGDAGKANQFRQAAAALQTPAPPPVRQDATQRAFEQAQTAVREQRWDDAYTLALHLIDTAGSEWETLQIMPQAAAGLAAHQQIAKGEQLFERVFAIARNSAIFDSRPLATVTHSYVEFLMGQDRTAEVPAAFEAYRRIQIEINGPGTGALAAVLRMQIDFERSRSQRREAVASARELLVLEEQLSGDTSEPYLSDLRLAAEVYDLAGDTAQAVPLLRKAIQLADQHNIYWQIMQTRTDLARALDWLDRHDEAAAVRKEAEERTRPLLKSILGPVR